MRHRPPPTILAAGSPHFSRQAAPRVARAWPFPRKLLRYLAVELRKLSVERYKGYAQPTELVLAPLTILVGTNNSGKTALSQAIQLLAGGVAALGKDASEPLPLRSGSIEHGKSFDDLVSGRPPHGWLRLSATLSQQPNDLLLSATVQNVITPSHPAERQISRWDFTNGRHAITLQRDGFDQRSAYRYRVSASGRTKPISNISWRGLLPRHTPSLPAWLHAPLDALSAWGRGVRHLSCPRSFHDSALIIDADHVPMGLGPHGRDTLFVLAADDDLRAAVRAWYLNAFGVSIDLAPQGLYFDLVVRAFGGAPVRLAQAGRGLAHVLPVVVTALTARKVGAGVDVIEHPEAELHPAAHAHVAELLLENLPGPARPVIVETHSEMLLLRARRWVAEGRLPASDVLIYWIQAQPDTGSTLQQIRIDERGGVDSWPHGVFLENYDEILAIRRAARRAEG